MSDIYEQAAQNFLGLASTQRLEILFNLLEKPFTPTALAKKIGATKQEVHRNFQRLEDHNLIEKNTSEVKFTEEKSALQKNNEVRKEILPLPNL